MTFTTDQMDNLRDIGIVFFEAGEAEVVAEDGDCFDVRITKYENCSYRVYVPKTAATWSL